MNRIRCSIAAPSGREDIADSAIDCVQAFAAERFETHRHCGSFAALQCEILVQVVDESCYERMEDELAALRQKCPQTGVLALAVNLSQTQLRGLLASGVQDFSLSPLNTEDFLTRLDRAAGLVPCTQTATIRDVLSGTLRDLVGNSPRFAKVLSILPRIAGCEAGVLILGESGTGKEVCARAVHYMSARASRPWVAVNCGALPPELIEAELFGHVRGAFTNAHTARSGLIREAEGGSLFLDEIDSMPLSAQCKLLRFLQDKQYRQVGSSQVSQADVRVIAASNRDLSKLVDAGTFRQDLFFRLNVLNLVLPPLRERRDDIAALSMHFLEQFAQRDKRPPLGLGPAALKLLAAYDWPGNVRELKHVLERAVLNSDGPVIQAGSIDLPAAQEAEDLSGDTFHAAKGRVVETFERDYIQRVLAQCGGNISHAARIAQKDRRAFFELMRKHKIRVERFGAANSMSQL